MRTLREQIATKCVHFNGVQHDKCEAGVTYQKGRSMPCIRFADERPPEWTCDKLRFPTEEEIQKRIAESDALVARFTKVAPLVGRIKKEHKGQSWKGVEVCPVCNGKLHLSHAAYNGHVWGKCETANCLAWME